MKQFRFVFLQNGVHEISAAFFVGYISEMISSLGLTGCVEAQKP